MMIYHPVKREERYESSVLTQRFLHKLSCLLGGLRLHFHAKSFVGPAVIVEVDPIAKCSCWVLKAFKAVPVDALVFQRSNYLLDLPVLLRTV